MELKLRSYLFYDADARSAYFPMSDASANGLRALPVSDGSDSVFYRVVGPTGMGYPCQRPLRVPWPYRKVIVSVHIFLRVFPYLPTAFAVWRMFLEIRYAHDVIRVKIADQ